MYQFPDEFRKAYESMTVPLVVFQFENEKVIPLLVSDGFCQLTGLNREKALEMMGASQYNRVHPDDAGKDRYNITATQDRTTVMRGSA